MTPLSAGFCIFADTHPDLAGFVVLVMRTVISSPHVLPPTFLLQPGFKLHKGKGADWRRVGSAALTELELAVWSRCAAGVPSVLLPSSARVSLPWSPERPTL